MNKNLRLLVSFATSDKLSGPLKNIVGLGQSGSEKLAAMKREARDLGRELRDVQDETKRSTGNVTQLMNRERDLADRIARTNDRMEQQTKLLKINAGAAAMKERGAELRSSGTQNVVTGVAMAAPLILAGKAGMEFQSGMTDIALKANLTVEETAKLQANILAAADAAKQLPENMRAGADVLAGFGMTPQQAVTMMAPIGKVATAYRAEIADLAAASFANFSNLKVPISENARALEIMASAGNSGAFEIKDMAQYFPALTAAAQGFGQHGASAVADLAAAAQIARKGTGDAASAAGNLQNLMAKINTEDSIKKFAKFGVDLPAALKKAYAEGKTPLEAIATITDKTLGGDLSKLSFLFGDMQAQQALRPLIQNMDEYRKIRSDALASVGAVDAAFDRRSGDGATQLQAMAGQLQTMALVAGPVLLPVLGAITDNIVAVAGAVTGWMQANPQAAATIVQLVGGLAAFKIGLGAVQIGLGFLLGPLGTVFAVWQKYKLLGSIAAVFPKITMALNLLRVGFVAMTGPVGLFVMLMAGLAYAVYANWDKIYAGFKAGVQWVKDAIGGLPDWLKNLGSMMMSGLLMALNPAILATRLIEIAKGGLTAFKNYFGIKSPSRLMMGMGGFITEGLATGIDRGKGGAISAARAMATGVAGASMATAGLAMASTGGGGGMGGAAGMHIGQITITVQALPGQSPTDIAQAVAAEFQRQTRIAGAAGRSSFRD